MLIFIDFFNILFKPVQTANMSPETGLDYLLDQSETEGEKQK